MSPQSSAPVFHTQLSVSWHSNWNVHTPCQNLFPHADQLKGNNCPNLPVWWRDTTQHFVLFCMQSCLIILFVYLFAVIIENRFDPNNLPFILYCFWSNCMQNDFHFITFACLLLGYFGFSVEISYLISLTFSQVKFTHSCTNTHTHTHTQNTHTCTEKLWHLGPLAQEVVSTFGINHFVVDFVQNDHFYQNQVLPFCKWNISLLYTSSFDLMLISIEIYIAVDKNMIVRMY